MYAKYTIHLKTLLADPEAKAMIDEALSKYPLYTTKSTNEAVVSLIPTREQLNKKLIDAYKYREIGFETPARFIEELEIAMCEIMPYYNQQLKTVEIMNELESPFDNVDFVETYKETRENTNEGESSMQSNAESSNESSSNTSATTKGNSITTADNTDNSKNVNSETPQGVLNIGTKNIDNVDYADRASWGESIAHSEGSTEDENESSSESAGTASATSQTSTTGETKTTDKTETEHTFTKKGNQGVNTYAHDIIEFRQTLLNIPQMIINDKRIKELFMMVY